MAWQKVSQYGGDSGDWVYWLNSETGEMSQTDPAAGKMSGPVGYTGSFEGESGGGTNFQYTNQAGSVLSDQTAGAAQYTKQLDDKFQSVINNPNASSWDKAMAVQERYGVESLAQLVHQGHFKDIAPQLGPHIAARQREGEAEGFSVGGNQLGNWPVVAGMLAGGLLGGTANAGASGAATESAAAGGTAASTGSQSMALGAGDMFGSGAAWESGTAGLGSTAGTTGGVLAGSGDMFGSGAAWDAGTAGLQTGAVAAPAGGAALEGATATGGGAATGGGLLGSGASGVLSNPSLIGALGGAALGGLSGTGSKQGTIQTEEGIPDWLMPYVKPTLDKYSTDVQNYNVDPYGIMPSAMQQFQKTIQGDFLSPDSNPYLNDYFRLGAERIKGSLSPTFGHMQAFGQHSGYNEALARGLGDFSVQLYGGAYDKERERQNQLTAAAPAFLGQNSQAQFQPFSQYLSSVGALGKSKETPYFTNPFSSILGGAMVGSQFGKMF